MKKILLYLLVVIVALAIFVRYRFGGGDEYPNLTSAPRIGEAAVEDVLEYPDPIGNVAVSADGRVFFTVHPESRPKGNKLLEFVDGAAEPFPDGASQARLFDTVLGVVIDRQNRLWTIDHGNHGVRDARLLAFDLASGEIVHDHVFAKDIAPAGSYLQDLQVSADGQTVVIADASFWRRRPALIIYDVVTASARRVLDAHESVMAEHYRIRNHGNDMVFLGGLVALRGGVNGIALGPEWLYYGALSGSSLHRVRLSDLTDATMPGAQLAAHVEPVARKPLSDGMSIDVDGNVYGTDVEHGAVFVIDASGELSTLLQSRRFRWPDALSFGPGGWLYIADSALADVILQTGDHIKANEPYKIYRFRPGTPGTPGQ